jgi:hypothetical protein
MSCNIPIEGVSSSIHHIDAVTNTELLELDSHEYRIVGADNKRPLLLSFCRFTFTNSISGKALKYAGKVLWASLNSQEETDNPCTLEKKVLSLQVRRIPPFHCWDSINAPANNKEIYLNILLNLRMRKLSLPQTHYTFLTDLKKKIYFLFVEGKLVHQVWSHVSTIPFVLSACTFV